MDLKLKLVYLILPIYMLLVVDEMVYTDAFMKSVRIEEIPFAISMTTVRNKTHEGSLRAAASPKDSKNIYSMRRLDQHKSFLKIFNIPYIICFFAAKGKWPFIPPFMQNRVDAAARTLFSQNDSFIKQFCQKWIQIKECFRPIFSQTTPSSADVITVSNQRCQCANLVATDAPVPIVYFDRDHIGNISVETIYNTIEFLENFLPPPTKKNKRKNRVRSRVDEMDIE